MLLLVFRCCFVSFKAYKVRHTNIQYKAHNAYMGGLVMMVISTKNWEFLSNSISTM